MNVFFGYKSDIYGKGKLHNKLLSFDFLNTILDSLPPSIPQVLINREPLPHMTFDIELLGNCDVIVQELTRRLHWGTLTAGSIPHPLSQIGEPSADFLL